MDVDTLQDSRVGDGHSGDFVATEQIKSCVRVGDGVADGFGELWEALSV